MLSTKPFSQKQLKQAIAWFVCLQGEQCSTDEQARFNVWLAQHPAHGVAYAEAERVWQGFESIKSQPIPGLQDARNVKPASWRRQAARLGVLLLAGVFGAGYLEYQAETVQYVTQLGERRTIALADNSILELNTDTQVAVKISFWQRRVTLIQGEALFNVAHERWRPFCVLADGLQIKDVGTIFNVNASVDRVDIAVFEGEVELSDTLSVQAAALHAGKQVTYDLQRGLQAVTALDAEKVSAWRRGQLVFKHTPLQAVVTELERYHNVAFVFADPKIAHEVVTGTFDADDLKPFLHALETILPLHVERKGRQIVLRNG